MANRSGYGTTETPEKQQIEVAEASSLKKIQQKLQSPENKESRKHNLDKYDFFKIIIFYQY